MSELDQGTPIFSPAARQVGGTLIVVVVLALVAWILYRAARRLDLGAWAHVDTGEALPFGLGGRARFLDDPHVPDTGAGIAPIVDMGAHEKP